MWPGVVDELLARVWRRRQRKLATCPVCREAIRELDDHVLVHRVRIHRECARYRPEFLRP
jgi:hypothetical protein